MHNNFILPLSLKGGPGSGRHKEISIGDKILISPTTTKVGGGQNKHPKQEVVIQAIEPSEGNSKLLRFAFNDAKGNERIGYANSNLDKYQVVYSANETSEKRAHEQSSANELMRRIKSIPPSLKGGDGSGNFNHSGRPGERGGSGEGGIKIDEELLKSTKINGMVMRGENTEIRQNGDTFAVLQRIGVGTSKPIATGFESYKDAKTFVDKHNGLNLTQSTGPAIDENADELSAEERKSLAAAIKSRVAESFEIKGGPGSGRHPEGGSKILDDKWGEGEVQTTRQVAARLGISTAAAYKQLLKLEQEGSVSKYGYRTKDGWEAPEYSGLSTNSIGWQRGTAP